MSNQVVELWLRHGRKTKETATQWAVRVSKWCLSKYYSLERENRSILQQTNSVIAIYTGSNSCAI